MAKNKLAVVLSEKNLSKGDIRTKTKLSKGTITKLYNQSGTVAPSTQEVIVTAINELSSSTFSIQDIFPPKGGVFGGGFD